MSGPDAGGDVRESGECHPVLALADELHDLGFKAGWDAALAKPDASNASVEARLRPDLIRQATLAADGIELLQDSMSLRRRTAELMRELVAALSAGGDEATKSTAAPRKFARCVNGHRSTVPDDAFSTDTASTHACPVCGYGVIVDSPGDLPRGDYPLSRSIGTASSPAGGDEATKSEGGCCKGLAPIADCRCEQERKAAGYPPYHRGSPAAVDVEAIRQIIRKHVTSDPYRCLAGTEAAAIEILSLIDAGAK